MNEALWQPWGKQVSQPWLHMPLCSDEMWKYKQGNYAEAHMDSLRKDYKNYFLIFSMEWSMVCNIAMVYKNAEIMIKFCRFAIILSYSNISVVIW